MEKEQDFFEQELASLREEIKNVQSQVSQVIVGQKKVIESLLIALLCEGHVLIEGLPGLAKTLLATTLSKALSLECKRIQFTPDLLPADLLGTSVYNPQTGVFYIKKGPVFTNVLLADEINRAPAKVQSALLEVMQEKQVTIQGETFQAGTPYFVLATQNPVEQEGTYPLPEAQIDRFLLKVRIDYPSIEEETQVLRKMAGTAPFPKINAVLDRDGIFRCQKGVRQVYVDEKIERYIVDIVFATRKPEAYGIACSHWISWGSSPRGTISLKKAAQAHAFLAGRSFVLPADIKEVAPEVLRHRIKPSFEAEAEEVDSDHILSTLLEKIPTP